MNWPEANDFGTTKEKIYAKYDPTDKIKVIKTKAFGLNLSSKKLAFAMKYPIVTYDKNETKQMILDEYGSNKEKWQIKMYTKETNAKIEMNLSELK